MKEYYVALDVGGTHCRVGLMESDREGDLKIHLRKQTKVYPEFHTGITALVNLIDEVSSGFNIQAIGGSFPGIIDEEKGVIRSATNLPDWNNQPIKNIIEERYQVPVGIFHDVAAAAMGEAVYGNGIGAKNFVFLIWGTGVGGAKVEKLMDKFHITSFEPGHHIADPNGDICECGLRGCPDMIMGGGPLSKKLNKNLAEIKDGDPIWEDVARIAGQTVINTLAFHQTPLLIFGGGLIQKRQFLLDRIEKYISFKQEIFKIPEIRMTKLGDNAALYGTVALQQVELI